MACDDPIMKQEESAHQVMAGTATYKIEGDILTITNNDMVLVFTRGSFAPEEPAAPASLTGAWKLVSFRESDVLSLALADVEAGLTFNEDGTFTGTAGCNEFEGSYTVEGDQIAFKDVVSTLMLCDTPLMEQEEAVQLILADTATYEIDGSSLTITNGDRALILER
jgi:heat shock protein HslJ